MDIVDEENHNLTALVKNNISQRLEKSELNLMLKAILGNINLNNVSSYVSCMNKYPNTSEIFCI